MGHPLPILFTKNLMTSGLNPILENALYLLEVALSAYRNQL
jgi:hypothetical protein